MYGRAEGSLEHGKGRLDLPTLAVKVLGEVVGKKAAKECGGTMVLALGRTAACRGDDPQHAQLMPKELVMVFAVIADVTQQKIEGLSVMGLAGQAVELDVVRLGTSVDHGAENHVALDVDNCGNLGKSAAFASGAATVVGAGRTAVHAGGIDGGHGTGLGDQAAVTGERDGGVEGSGSAPFFSRRRWASCSVR